MKSDDLKFKKRWIPWALDFMKKKFDPLTTDQKKTLLTELFFWTSPRFSMESFEEFCRGTASLTFKNSESGVNKYFSNDEEEDDEIEMIPFVPNAKEVQKILRSFWEELLSFLKRLPSEESLPLPKVSPELIYSTDSLDEKDITVISYSIDKISLENVIKTNFARLFDGLEIDSIKKCQGCNRYFFNPTRRKKTYCSSRCAAKSIAQKKRVEVKKDPEKYQAYMEKYRKYASKRHLDIKRTKANKPKLGEG